MSGGRFPPPEMVAFPTGNGPVASPAYYYGQQAGVEQNYAIVPEADGEQRIDPQELPPLPAGRAWTFARTTEGKIYWVEDDAARVAAAQQRKIEEARKWAEREARIAEDVARSNEPASAPATGSAPGSRPSLEAMRQRIADNSRQLGDVVGGSVRITESATGFRIEVFEGKGGVSTSTGGKKIGTVTLDKTGKPVAVDIPGATVTSDGRIIVGKEVKLFGLSIHAKGALSLEDGLRGLTSIIAEAVTDFGEGLGLGTMSADGVPDV